jgi:hypothetical protein
VPHISLCCRFKGNSASYLTVRFKGITVPQNKFACPLRIQWRPNTVDRCINKKNIFGVLGCKRRALECACVMRALWLQVMQKEPNRLCFSRCRQRVNKASGKLKESELIYYNNSISMKSKRVQRVFLVFVVFCFFVFGLQH